MLRVHVVGVASGCAVDGTRIVLVVHSVSAYDANMSSSFVLRYDWLTFVLEMK